MTSIPLALIVAFDDERAIGADGDIPWYHPEDLQHFKEETIGHSVIAGRKTYENIVDTLGQPLPDRTMIVLSESRTEYPDGVHHASSVDEAIATAEELAEDTVYVIGGESVYSAYLPEADELIITRVSGTHNGDTFFPRVNWDRWDETERTALTDDLRVERYRRTDEHR